MFFKKKEKKNMSPAVSVEEFQKATEALYKQNLEVVTLNKKLEQLRMRLEQSNLDLEVANSGQANLIHIINHQIKGYLSKARNIFSEFISNPIFEQKVTDEARQYSEQGFEILTEGVQFVQGVLNASSIEKGTLQYDMQPLDVRELISDLSKEQQSLAQKKGLTYEEYFEEGNYVIQGDKQQLRETFKNIIDNAIRYTPKGSIVIKLEPGSTSITCSIIDSGIGINDEDKKRLFTTGGKGKNSSKINVDSTGYGLVFAKGVLEAHKGTITAFSKGEGFGSTFTITLPISQ
jgi:signal transduction histidine kinase